MAVLIEDMDMPKSCPCKLVGIGYDMYCSFVYGIPARIKEYDECCEKKTRPDWCPLIEVPKPHTNADKIRSMTNEELAEFISRQIIDRNIGVPVEAWLDWLRDSAI